MGAGSFLALVARHSLRPVRQHSKLAAAQIYDLPLSGHERASHATPTQFVTSEPPALPLLNSFHLDLAERLQQLQLHGAGSAHLNWLLDALASSLSTHSSLQLALSASSAASTGSVASAAKHRADEVLSMLDVCTALKQVAHDLDRQFRNLHHVLECVDRAVTSGKPLSRGHLHTAAHRLSVCLTNNIFCITGNQYRPLAEARTSLLLAAKREILQSTATPYLAATPLSQALDGAMLTSLLVLASAVSSLTPPSPRKSSSTIPSACKIIIKYLGAKSVSAPWAASLRQLHHDLRQEDISAAGGAFFQEVQGLHCAAAKLHTTITTPGVHPIEVTGVKQAVESLRKRLREAESCVGMFSVQIASFFQALIALRLALLDS